VTSLRSAHSLTPAQDARSRTPAQIASSVTPLQAARDHPEIVAGLLAAAGLAWWWTAERMAGMDGGPGAGLGTLGWFTGSWAVMMAAMMLPAFAPALLAYVTLTHGNSKRRSLPFACGYLLTWTVAGVAAYGLYELGKALLGSDLAWHDGGRWASAAVLAAAAAYEFNPLKRSCLTRCRGQLGELRDGSRQPWSAALAMGARSGVWCLGCSWALTAALFALGVMSLTWMGLVAALVALEKIFPWPFPARLATAIVLVLIATAILAAPHQLPGFVVPTSGGTHSMKAMG
jgi:predicted metal-binding membrane protein